MLFNIYHPPSKTKVVEQLQGAQKCCGILGCKIGLGTRSRLNTRTGPNKFATYNVIKPLNIPNIIELNIME